MLGYHKNKKRFPVYLLLSLLAIILIIDGCLLSKEVIWNVEKTYERNENKVDLAIEGDLDINSGSSAPWPDTLNPKHAWEAFQFPSEWSGSSLTTSYQIFKKTEKGDSLIRTDTLTWHYSRHVTEKAQAKMPAEKGNTYRGFESDQTIPWDSVRVYAGPDYHIHFRSVLAIANADSLGKRLCGEIIGDELDGLWTGYSFIVDGAIPSMTQWGVIILAVLIVTSAVFILLKRRKVTVSA